MSTPLDVDVLLLNWSPSFSHPDIKYIVEVTAGGQKSVLPATNSTSLLFTPAVLSCSPYNVRVKASNELGQETDYGESINAYIINDTSEIKFKLATT